MFKNKEDMQNHVFNMKIWANYLGISEKSLYLCT